MSGKKRPLRTQRRAAERDARKLVRARHELALLERGGAADRPITVTSSSVIEVRARSLPCPLCQGEYAIDDHTAETAHGRSLRVVHVTCRRCGVRRKLYFDISSPLPS